MSSLVGPGKYPCFPSYKALVLTSLLKLLWGFNRSFILKYPLFYIGFRRGEFTRTSSAGLKLFQPKSSPCIESLMVSDTRKLPDVSGRQSIPTLTSGCVPEPWTQLGECSNLCLFQVQPIVLSVGPGQAFSAGILSGVISIRFSFSFILGHPEYKIILFPQMKLP